MTIDRVMAKKVNWYRQTNRLTDRPTERPNDICITRAPMELKIVNLCSIKCDTFLESQDKKNLKSDDNDDDNDDKNDNNNNNSNKNLKSLKYQDNSDKISQIWGLVAAFIPVFDKTLPA